jgi:serine-type D-Ala-D-Ala carboxypeptidase/endopeptidase (penicillin-binding protein 4)
MHFRQLTAVLFLCAFIFAPINAMDAGPTRSALATETPDPTPAPIAAPTPDPTPAPTLKMEIESPKKRLIRRQINLLLKDTAIKGASVGIYAKNLNTGKVLYRRGADKLFIPASTNKIITGAAALEILGPKYRFKTEVRADQRINAEGILEGNLYIRGGGDPSFSVEEVWLLAHQIAGTGLTHITGNVVGDDSFFDSVRYYESWGFSKPRSYAAPMSALSFNWNKVQAYVSPGAKSGQAAHVTLNPESDYFTLTNYVKTCTKCRSILSMRLKGQDVTVSGKIHLNAQPMVSFASVEDPLPVAVHAIKKMLEHEGVQIDGQAVAGAAPETTHMLFTHESRDLSQIIRYLYRYSNNLTAENILKTMGAAVYEGQATRENACKAALKYMKDNNLFQSGVVIDDGSGLSRNNRQSPKSMVKTLMHVADSPEIHAEFLEALAIGGVDGTLAYRFKGTKLERRVRAKTGYLYGVVTLAGYSWNAEGEPFAFAIFINDPPAKTKVRDVKNKVDEILLTLMQ